MIPPSLCIQCKGRLWCNLGFCPIIEKFSVHKKAIQSIKKNSFKGPSPPGIFVSHTGYPKVSVAPLATSLNLKNPEFYDLPEAWFGLKGEKIIEMREQLIRSSVKLPVKSAANPDRKLYEFQELSISKKSVEVEVELKKRPKAIISYSSTVAPLGPVALLKKIRVENNPKIPKKIEYYFYDGEALSETALQELHKKRVNVSFLHKMLSIGCLGIQKNRKLVPTRWAITAVDSTISKNLVNKKIKFFQEISETMVFQSKYLDNTFFVLLHPGKWCFELIEAWQPGSSWAVNAKKTVIAADHEFYEGRKKYAENTAGGYYAARLAVAEALTQKKRQASCIVFREIGEGYSIPLGVWQVRENVRNALKKRPLKFDSIKLALEYIAGKTNIGLKKLRHKSAILDKMFFQRKLMDFV